MFFASLLAGFTFIGIFLVFIILIGLLGDEKPKVKPNSILKINLNAEITDRTVDSPFGSFDFIAGQSTPKVSLNDTKKALRLAKDDPNIRAVYLNVSTPIAGPATLKELREILVSFREESDIPIYAFSEVYTQKAYYLASASDTIILHPEGMIEFSGVSANVAYYKNVLNKIGVKPEIVRGSNNKFKSAVEPFIEDSMSTANRNQLEALLGGIWNDYLEGIASTRDLTVEDLQAISDRFAVHTPKQALSDGMVDVLWYKDEVLEFLKELCEAEEINDIETIGVSDYLLAEREELNRSKNRIAVIYASGEIGMGRGDEQSIGSETLSKAIRKARLDDKVKAIVLRVNSPGGSAMASDVIWREMELSRKVKPVVVSMSDYAASGGYYISAPADTIVAQSNTITGSIGIFMMLFTAEDLIENKIGIHYDNVKTSEYADLLSLNQSLTEDQKAKLQFLVDQGYGSFISRVANGRSMDSLMVDSIGQGRVWTGRQAMDIGLVDVEGGLDVAVELAARMAELDDYKLKELPALKTPLEQLMEDFGMKSMQDDILKEELGNYYSHLQTLKRNAGAGIHLRPEWNTT